VSTEPNADDFARAMEGRSYKARQAPPAGGDIARVLGLVLTGFGFFGAYFWVWTPIRGVLAGAYKVEWGFKALLITPFALIAGIILLLFGMRAAQMLDPDSKSPLRWVALVLVLMGLGLALGIRWWFGVRGYS
jgi:hypothetical protein